ncbi:MAG: DEAD/DEAH box helicase family protein, partial [Nitrososphaeraceae archaeon]
MTFKDLKKRLSLETTFHQQSKLSEILMNKPFWIWNIDEHEQEDAKTNGDCCFNHIIGLPKREAVDKPLYDYEKIIFDDLDTKNGNTNHSKYIWIEKATGLGISEFMLRFMAWLCLKDNVLSGSQMCMVTGPRIDLAIALIDRMKKLFAGSSKGLTPTTTFDIKETVIDLNNVKIEAFPSHHLDAMRGLPNVSFILLDEADFFPPGQQQDARDVSERYIAKSNPYIVMVSTPNAPDGLFERIEKEAEDICLYKRIFLDYTYGIGKIYTEYDIDKAKQSPSFEREYNLKYLDRIGNVFHTKDIEAAIEKGRKYHP